VEGDSCVRLPTSGKMRGNESMALGGSDPQWAGRRKTIILTTVQSPNEHDFFANYTIGIHKLERGEI
jgi:hypothetical protein